ncbi:hypothetical protein NFC81_14920 [Salinispirillum sp. LH 10-3-1]|uniref:Transporter n=1 Tax=Salinispirillum sp. LH 10-3-1 TaxID=2952525 RepID=A0AB38YFN3_9GAMM
MLRKAIALPLLAGLAIPVFADDANVLPQGVLRTTIAPSITTIDSVFESDGSTADPQFGKVTVNTLSLALEYGVTDWLTAGVQWAPGYVLSGGVADEESIDLSGANDLFVGAKIQLLGSSGLSRSDSMRLAITPGIKIPTSSYDADAERSNALASDDFRPQRTDRGAWGLGARTSFDLIITENFYINLYNQTSVFLETTQDFGVQVVEGVGVFSVEDAKVQYGTEMIFEAEANYTMNMANGIRTSFGLPVTYTMTGETEVNGNVSAANEESWSVAVGPSVSVFFTQWALPMEFQLGYSTVLAGENSNATNTISLQVKNFLRL